MIRCRRCIIPETAKGIVLDKNGLCNLCNGFNSIPPKGEEALEKEIKIYIEKDDKFNCIVPVSGGRDSAYALYYVKKILGLRPLAVHSNNDFETEIATKNLENITKSMKVPLICTRSKERLLKKIVAEKFKMNSHFGAWRMVEQTCEACKYGFESASYNTARENNIQLVIWGDSIEESTTSYHILAKHKTLTKWERLLSPGILNYVKYKYYFYKMKKEYGPDSPDGLKEVHLYDYIKWDRKIIVNTIQEKLKWSKPKESATSWRIDCKLIPIVDYLTKKAYGVSKIELGYSQMIRSRKMEREDALTQINKIKKTTNIDGLRSFLRELNIPNSCIEKII